MDQLSQRFGAAVDFSTLGKPEQAPASSNPVDTETPKVISLPSLIGDLDETNIQNFLALSAQLPILVDVYTLRSEASTKLSQKLIAEVTKRAGSVLLLRLDGDANAAFLKAFQVQHLPSVTALLKGQAIPLFAGDQSEDSITQVIDRMLLVAAENSVTAIADAPADYSMEPTLPTEHLEILELIDNADYLGAIAKYQKLLAASPADQLAIAGLAQVQLLERTKNFELASVTTQAAASQEAAIDKADALAVIGKYPESFTVLLDRFEVAEKPEREVLKAHLLELFKIVPSDDSAVATARMRLANLLF